MGCCRRRNIDGSALLVSVRSGDKKFVGADVGISAIASEVLDGPGAKSARDNCRAESNGREVEEKNRFELHVDERLFLGVENGRNCCQNLRSY